MAEVESQLWWYKALHEKILNTLRYLPLPLSAPVLDAGCGTGGLMSVLTNAGFSNVSGFDISPAAAAICQERGFPIKILGIQDIGKAYEQSSCSAIISSDVLCYLTPEETPACLREIKRTLLPGGYLILNLPAYREFSGIHDKSVGITTRTSERLIRQQLTDASFQIVELHHWPFILAPVIFLTRLKQRLTLRIFPDCTIKSDIDLPSPFINRLLFMLANEESRLGKLRCLGSSVFVVARKDKNM
jgi:SAM-dependent methyltransferase